MKNPVFYRWVEYEGRDECRPTDAYLLYLMHYHHFEYTHPGWKLGPGIRAGSFYDEDRELFKEMRMAYHMTQAMAHFGRSIPGAATRFWSLVPMDLWLRFNESKLMVSSRGTKSMVLFAGSKGDHVQTRYRADADLLIKDINDILRDKFSFLDFLTVGKPAAAKKRKAK